MSTKADTLFGRFTGQSKLKQDRQRIRLTPEQNTGERGSNLALLTEAVELEGSFGIVVGNLDGDTLYEARVEEVVPPILSGVLDRLLKQRALDVETMLPKVQQSIRSLVGDVKTRSKRRKPLCALVIGHRESARGAVSSDRSVTEFDFNSELAKEIKKRVTKSQVRIVFRDNTPNGLNKLPAKINAVGPSFILSLHCNAFNNAATGTETLYFHSSKRGRKLASIIQKQLVGALELKDRKIRSKKDGDRGASVLKFTDAPCVICEPFFIDNDGDLDIALRRRKSLAAAYARSIDKAAVAFG
ncbi:MAG: N-acetylmuramoyl-L-alanine amidase [Woeseiaceae bacterium]